METKINYGYLFQLSPSLLLVQRSHVTRARDLLSPSFLLVQRCHVARARDLQSYNGHVFRSNVIYVMRLRDLQSYNGHVFRSNVIYGGIRSRDKELIYGN